MRSSSDHRLHPSLTLVLAAALVAGCGEPGTSGPSSEPVEPEPASDNVDGDWNLVEGDTPDGEIPQGVGRQIVLRLRDGTLEGDSACNGYDGFYTFDDGALLIDEGTLGFEEMRCDDAIMSVEIAYGRALERVERADRAGDQLTLTGPEIRLSFTTAPETTSR